MKSAQLLLAALPLVLAACAGAGAAPTPTTGPTPAPTATASPSPAPAFDSSRLGTVERDVTYCMMGGLSQTLDVYFPESGGPWPVLFYVHGGSWVEGDKADGVGWGEMTAQGYLVVSVNYRLATYQVKFPAMIEDVKCGVRYLRAHAADYNLDPQRIGAIGASAGGHLAALLGTADEAAGWDVGDYLDQSSRVQAVLTMAGPSDFGRNFPSLNTSIYFAFGDLAGGDSAVMTGASPVTYVTPDDPPFLILHGDKDGVVPVEQGTALHERLESAGVASTLVIVEGGDHSLQGLSGRQTVPSQDAIAETIREFLDATLK